ALRTFLRPRYEIVATGAVHDGEAAVRRFLAAQWESMPPLRYEATAVYFGTDGLMVETRTLGTSARGTAIDMTSVNLFGFEDDGLVLERCFFDQVTVGNQLGGPS